LEAGGVEGLGGHFVAHFNGPPDFGQKLYWADSSIPVIFRAAKDE
jgi:hypothetical protein